MQRTRHTPILILTLALLMGLFPMRDAADSLVGKNCVSVTTRPFTDFLKAQGTLNDPPQFFPPVQDYNGWTDGNFTTFALIDYAGLAHTYLEETKGLSLGTKVRGLVLECVLTNHTAQITTAQITVALFTTKALGFAQSIAELTDNPDKEPDFLNTPTIFGAKAVSGEKDPGTGVVDGADVAVGSATLVTTFSIAAPGAALPDFLAVINTEQHAPATLHFTSITFGTCADGRKAFLHVHQVAATDADKK